MPHILSPFTSGTREVRAIDPRIEIIGPETIASDLDGKYPALAHTVLGVPLGKGSFIAPDRFIERSLNDRFSTDLSKLLMHRDSEFSVIVESIEQNKAVVDSGAVWIGEKPRSPSTHASHSANGITGIFLLGL